MYAIRSYYVATAVDGSREIVDDGKDGFLCPPGDVESLAGRVVSVLTGASRLDPSYKRDRLLAEFHQSEMVRAQERLYEELLRITSYNVCYTKLLRAPTFNSTTPLLSAG